MNAISQYLDLWAEHENLVCGKSSEALNRLRAQAVQILRDNPLPPKGSENYEQTDLSEMLAPDYGINVARVPIDVNPADSFRCDVPQLSTSLFFIINDAFAEAAGSRSRLPEGVTLTSLAAYARKNPGFVEKYYGKIADINNPIVALDTLLCQDGVVLHVEKGVKIVSPIQIVNIFHNGAPLLAARRVLIVMEEDSEAKILMCDHTQSESVEFCSLQVMEIFAGCNCHLDLYDLEESSPSTNRLSAIYMHQDEASDVLLDTITLFNGKTRNEFHTSFRGERARLRLYGMGIEDDQRRLDTYSRIAHDVPRCSTDELFKYIVDDNAVGAFAGLIYVADGAVKTEAYQSNRNLVGSATARMFSKPQLEIYNDDVKCSHGTAIGQLDEKQLFYMMTRGIAEEDARLILKQAFMSDVIEGIALRPLRDRLKMMVERRFSGESSACSVCHAPCGL